MNAAFVFPCFLEWVLRLKKPTHRKGIAWSIALSMSMVILISGCATTKPPISEAQRNLLWKQQLARNSNLSDWMLKGKIGVKTGGKGGTATLKWAYQNEHQDIELYGPFGGGRVQISVTSDWAILKDTKGVVIEGLTADQVLYQRLGWQVPFSELIMWCRGLPDDHATDLVIDDYGRLKSFNQGVWHVEYQAYRSVNDLILPRKLTITSLPGSVEIYDDDGKYIDDTLRVKLIFKRWSNISLY